MDMRDILHFIVEHKRQEVAGRKFNSTLKTLENSVHFARPTVSLRDTLVRSDHAGIIAEFKRMSPSKGVIHATASVEGTTTGYVRAGASALSILTDSEFFGGSSADLEAARAGNTCPILRKDFIVDEYQVIEAKSIGADVILLIAAILDPPTLKIYCSLAHSLGLEVLMEVHDEEDCRRHDAARVDMIGVNNRNLKTFEVNLETSRRLSDILPSESVWVSESGIDSPEAIVHLTQLGFRGFLVGQAFMEKPVPEEAAATFIGRLRQLEFKSRNR